MQACGRLARPVVAIVATALTVVTFAGRIWAEPPPGTTIATGEKSGAIYAMYVPENWNGDLVLYAHGFVARQHPIALPDPEEPDPTYGTAARFRDALLAEGFAVALSSYSKTGWAVREGFWETRGLIPMFRREFGRPSHIYITGQSMGGLITVRLAEMFHRTFDGALPMCGVVGGANLQFDQIVHFRALFDYFYPEVLPEGLLHVPDATDPLDVMLPGLDAMVNDLRPVAGWYELGLIGGLDLPTDPNLVFDAILIRLWAQGGVDLFERTNGKSFWRNLDTYYAGSFDDATLNALIERVDSHPRGRLYLKRWYEPSGRLRVPTLSLHNAIDPLVPITHEVEYAERVAEQGMAHNLVQRVAAAAEYGHCAFTVEEQLGAFLDLVNWVDNGVTPTP